MLLSFQATLFIGAEEIRCSLINKHIVLIFFALFAFVHPQQQQPPHISARYHLDVILLVSLSFLTTTTTLLQRHKRVSDDFWWKRNNKKATKTTHLWNEISNRKISRISGNCNEIHRHRIGFKKVENWMRSVQFYSALSPVCLHILSVIAVTQYAAGLWFVLYVCVKMCKSLLYCVLSW